MSIGIYKITNKINGKSYIGLSTNIEERFKKHRQCQGDKILYSAFRKYGIENFDFSIIELCCLEELSEKEKYWIAYYDTYNNGYNATLGGEGQSLINHEEVIQDFLITNSCRATAKNLGISVHSVSQIIIANNIEHKKFEECGGQNKKEQANLLKLEILFRNFLRKKKLQNISFQQEKQKLP